MKYPQTFLDRLSCFYQCTHAHAHRRTQLNWSEPIYKVELQLEPSAPFINSPFRFGSPAFRLRITCLLSKQIGAVK